MKTKLVKLTVASSLLALSAAAFASCPKGSDVAGAYFRADVTDATAQNVPIFILDQNGNAYDHGSISMLKYVSSGMFSPGVGNWKCDRAGNIIITTLSFSAKQSDRNITPVRITYKMQFTAAKELLNTQIVGVELNPNDSASFMDPNAGTVFGNVTPTTPRPYKRVKSIESDLSRHP